MSVAGLCVVYIYIWLGLERGSGRANRKWCARAGRLVAHHFLLARPLPRSKPSQIYIPRTILPLTYFIHLPMKMEPIVSSETSAIRTQTPGNYPKRNKLHLEHGESLKTRLTKLLFVHLRFINWSAVCTSYESILLNWEAAN